MVFSLLALCLVLCAACVFVRRAGAQEQPSGSHLVIERIEFVGNRRMARDMLLARIFSRPGDLYSPEAARRDFQALWNTQYFEDIRLEVENSPDKPGEMILVYYLQRAADHSPNRIQGQ